MRKQNALSLNSLQVGRALAATAVAAFHLSLMMGDGRYGGQTVFAEYTRYGFLGVDFFFVLSGFIIVFAHGRDVSHPQAWRSYAWRRFVRLFPIYWLYTGVLCVLVLLGFGTAVKLPASAPDILTSLTLVRFSPVDPPLPVAWTLFHEIAFYAAFGVLIVSARAGIALFAVWALLCIAVFHHAPSEGAEPFAVYTAASNLYFLLGIGAFYLYRRGGSGMPETLSGLCLVALSLAALQRAPDIARFTLVCGFALALAGVAKWELAGGLRFPRWAVYVGDASYSIYLLHESLSGLLLAILIKTHLDAILGRGLTYLVVLGITVPLGCLAYALVEKPILSALRRRKPAPPAKPVPAY